MRALQGVALAGLPAVGVAYLREELHPSVSARAIGLFIGGNAIGGLTGRLLGGFLTDLGGWRAACAAIAVLGVACTVAVRLLLPPLAAVRPGPARRAAGPAAVAGGDRSGAAGHLRRRARC